MARKSISLLVPAAAQTAIARDSDFSALADRGEVSPELRQQLMDLVGNDPQLAETWLTRARFGHGGRSESYYWERAIELHQIAQNQNDTD